MDPITIGISIFLSLGATVTLYAIIKFADVVKWFSSQVAFNTSGKIAIKPLGIDASGTIGFTLADRISDGKYKIIQGVFDKPSQKVISGRVIEGKKIDNKLKGCHEIDNISGEIKEKLVIYS